MAFMTWIAISQQLLRHMNLVTNQRRRKIVGLQTDVPLKQAFMPFGGIKMANNALVSNGYETDEEMTKSSQNTEKHITKVF